MILNFSVENFKSIRNKINLSFEPVVSESSDEYYISSMGKSKILKMALIFGPNASGKTSIIEALSFLKQLVEKPFKNKSFELDFKPFVLDKDKDTAFSIEFVNDKRYLYAVQFNKKCIVKESLYSFSPKKSLIFERNTDQEKELSQIKFGSKVKISSSDKKALIANTLWNDTVIASSLSANINFDDLKFVLAWFQKSLMIEPGKFFPFLPASPRVSLMEFLNLVFGATASSPYSPFYEFLSIDNISKAVLNGKIPKDRLIELLRKADLSVSDIEVELKDMKLQRAGIENHNTMQYKITYAKTIFQHSYDENFSLSLNDESSGTKRYYLLLGILLEALFDNESKVKVIAIDELERSLHPDLVEHFILTFLKVCKRYNFQLIATTHNRELLMNKDLIRKDVIWFTEKKADGSTDLFSLSDFKEVRKENSIYNFYKIGKFGAVPNLIDSFDEDVTK
jgi:AAA15 family ATPase/GTPase